jgi:putative Ig domain-containing protein
MMMNLAVAALYIAIVAAVPQVALSFNAQVPNVARVGQQYNFDLSPSTFTTSSGPLAYSLTNEPAWLHINSINGTLSGVPGSGDAGSSQFDISASDSTGSASFQATLVVSSDPAPQIGEDIAETVSNVGTKCGLRCITVPPLASLKFQLPKSIFTTSSSQSYYYATLEDHTPLPSWLKFNSNAFQLTGNSPQVGALAQRFDINVIVSDVAGFAAATQSLTIIVSQHQLMFDTPLETQNVPAGESVDIANLKSHLYLDGSPISNSSYGSAIILGPSWVDFDPKTLSLSGSPPNTFGSVNITINAHDTFADAAFITIQLNIGVPPLFTGHIGLLNATAGKEFYYQLSKSDFAQQSIDISVNLGAASPYLHFDPSTLTIEGTVPWNTSPQIIEANITVTSNGASVQDFQEFEIDIGS